MDLATEHDGIVVGEISLLHQPTGGDQQRIDSTLSTELPTALDYLEGELPEQGYLFGEIGLELGAEPLVEQTRKFGFGQNIPLEMPFAEGRIPPVEDSGPSTASDGTGASACGIMTVR